MKKPAIHWFALKQVALYAGLALGLMTLAMLSYNGLYSAQSAQEGSQGGALIPTIEVVSDAVDQETEALAAAWKKSRVEEISQPIPLQR